MRRWPGVSTTHHSVTQPPPKVKNANSAGYHIGNLGQLNYYLKHGLNVSDGDGQWHQASAEVVQQAWAASKGNPKIFSMMMAQMSRESGFNAGAIQQGVPESQRGYGIAQFTASLSSAGLKMYLGSSDPAVWHKAALNQKRAIAGLEAYDQDLLAASGGNMQQALAAFNGGPHPNAQACAYGAAVAGSAQQIEGSLDVTVTRKDSHGATVAKQHRSATVHPPKGHKNPI